MDPSIEAMSSIPNRMYEAWNRGDAAGFFADFADDVFSPNGKEPSTAAGPPRSRHTRISSPP
jgi:hypothetical protein